MKLKTDPLVIIFDFDGVINDSAGPGLERIIQLASKAGHEIPQDIRARLLKHWGTHGTKLLKIAFGLDDKSSGTLYREWERVDATNYFPLIPSAKRTLQNLKSELGLKMGMLTSRNRQNLMDVLNHYGLTENFDAIQCRDDYAVAKPDPRAFDYILCLLGAPKDVCVYVGDTLGDLQAAKVAGVRFVGVETGFLKRSDWQAVGLESENIIPDIGFLSCWILKHF